MGALLSTQSLAFMISSFSVCTALIHQFKSYRRSTISYNDSAKERKRVVDSSTHKLRTGFEDFELSCCCSDWIRGIKICAASVGSLVSPVAVAQN